MADKSSPRLSVIVPMYNEQAVIEPFFDHIIPVLDRLELDWEIICVNDGSRDGTLAILLAKSQRDERIKVIDLARNFGKEIALTAGLDHASGDAIVPIDADLQDPPELIEDFVARWREGYDVVIGMRADRSSDHFAKRTSAAWFYRLFNRLSHLPIPPNAGDFRLMDRQVVEVLKCLPERTRFMKGLFAWPGFRHTIVTFERQPRIAGTGKWKAWQLWNFALEGLFSFSSVPLRVWSYFGLMLASLAFVYMIFTIVKTLILGIDVPGYGSIITVLLFSLGVNLIGIGMLGEYMGRIFTEVKRRPLYVIRDRFGLLDLSGPALRDDRGLISIPTRERHWSTRPQ